MRTRGSSHGGVYGHARFGRRAIWLRANRSGALGTPFPLRLARWNKTSLEQDLYGNGLTDPTSYDEIYERELLVELVERRIESDHRDEIRQVFTMLRQGYTWEEIALRLHDPKPEALKKRFWRWIKQNFPKNRDKSSPIRRRHMP